MDYGPGFFVAGQFWYDDGVRFVGIDAGHGLGTSHRVTLTGLTANTTYDFDVVSANGVGMPANSANATFVTTPQVSSPPVISNVATTNVASTSVTVTDYRSAFEFGNNYGLTTGYGSSSPANTTLVTAHTVTPNGLTASTVGSAAYTINTTAAATPTFSPAAGTYTWPKR